MGYYKVIIFFFLINLEIFIECKGQKKNKKKSSVKDTRKREATEKDLNTMLMFDSSNGFQRAIQNDIDDLNNPSLNNDNKRSEVPTETKVDNKAIDYDLKNPISELIIDQIRYVTAVEREKQRYLCIVNNNKYCPEDNKNTTVINSQTIDPVSPQFKGINQKESTNYVSQSTQSTPIPINIQLEQQKSNNSDSNQYNDNSNFYCGDWSQWGQCSDVCKNGVSMRYRECFNSNVKTIEKDVKQCSNPDCSYCTEWSQFSSCSKICGEGLKTKYRTCVLKNGTAFQDYAQENCNFHPCQPLCEPWSDWSECSKPCDTGVKIRNRSCTLADRSKKTFYEHKACFTQPCVRSEKNDTKENIFTENDEEMCLSAHISFERFQYNVFTAYDNTHEHNDIEYQNTILFNGNLSCGYSAVLTGRKSVIKFYDDIFRNFDHERFMVAFWFYPIKTTLVENKMQTVFSLSSKKYNYGKYSMVLDENYQPTMYFVSKNTLITANCDFKMETDTWHHIGVSFSGEEENITFVHNGKVIDTKISKFQLEQNQNNLFPSPGFQGFGNDANYSTSLSGVIDEIYVMKCNIPIDQIKNIANTCKIHEENYCPTPSYGICPDKLPFKLIDESSQDLNTQESVTPLNIASKK